MSKRTENRMDWNKSHETMTEEHKSEEHLNDIFYEMEDAREDTLQRISRIVFPLKQSYPGDLIKRQREKIRAILQRQEVRIHAKLNEAPFGKFIDKCSFTLGVLWSWATMMVLSAFPALMAEWYAFCIALLLPLRFFLYRRKRWHYFLFDFCYWTQALLLLYLFAFPAYESLFRLLFTFANGPLAWAIPLWRNSLVFHNPDKLTSVIIHTFPMLVSFSLRWFPSTRLSARCDLLPDEIVFCHEDTILAQFFFRPIAVYSIWQLFYFLKTELSTFRVSSEIPIAKDSEVMTSFKWLSGSSGLVGQLLQSYSPQYRVYGFMGLQFVYTCLTFLPIPLLFFNFHLHLAFICFIITVSLWNGANFYVEVFTSSYRFRKEAEKSD